MIATNPDTDIESLQVRLRKAKRVGDKASEVDTLLAIGRLALEEDTRLAMMHFRLAEKVMGVGAPRLHEAIGGQGRVLRRANRFQEAVECFARAEQAATSARNRFARISWMLRRASAHRVAGEGEIARAVVLEADALLRPPVASDLLSILGPVDLVDAEQVGTLAELEGQTGLDCAALGDDLGAEDHYRSAWELAAGIESWDAVQTWSRNAGNVCARGSRYSDALACHEAALTAARQIDSERLIAESLRSLGSVYASAFRFEEGGDRLRLLAGELAGRAHVPALDEALQLYNEGLVAEGALAIATELQALSEPVGLSEKFLASVAARRARAEQCLHAPSIDAGPPALDLYLTHVMGRGMEQKLVPIVLGAAHLVCDVRLALALRGGKEWRRLIGGDVLHTSGLDHRVVVDALSLLVEAEDARRAADLLQRYKAPAFCATTIRRLWEAGAADAQLQPFLDAARALADAIEPLSGVAQADFVRHVYAMRRAGEHLRETGEAIRVVDPILHAQLGLSVHAEDLADALPIEEGVAIVDLLVGAEATRAVIYQRTTHGVVLSFVETRAFRAEHAVPLLNKHFEVNLSKSLGGKQTEALLEIGKALHDRLFCGLARSLSERGVTQLIVVPDLITRGLPLHLAMVCGSEFAIPGIDTTDADFLCEVMPIEYAPALQAVAVGQARPRPHAIRSVAGFADPHGDLLGAQIALEAFGKRVGEGVAWSLASGPELTREALSEAVRSADMVVVATHGNFMPGELQASHLVTHDGSWSLADMLKLGDLESAPLLVLQACEAGAVNILPNEQLAWGIPGALIGAGASAILANLWPVVDVTANLVLEHFLRHLAHPGFRPAAALFRAVRDLRRTPRDAAIAACRAHLTELRARQAPPRAIAAARQLMEWVEDSDSATPFESPYFWGATVIVGSGWHAPAGGQVGSNQRIIDNQVKLSAATQALSARQFREAGELGAELALESDGTIRARALAVLADSLFRSADITTVSRIRRRAVRALGTARRIARAQEDDELLEWIDVIRNQMENGDVVKEHD